ncbi:E3 ubiquitin-protein ligase highwire-like isoform X2 [Episyrphus balteatus]|uniref:E3 ubiquitin-protein ligase highwire-like isoform X2 n=1 Tax=Episyrphus balteatus TaxID=286459 RepID=UPI002486604C|nr:E3 ubiquitin-protein ligase highwire-like isoform X2 [Episyrphus balteatus]
MDTNGGSQVDSNDIKPSERRHKYDIANLCDFDDHHVAQGQCRVCVVCKECTGYNISCVSSHNVPVKERMPGAVCPCGHGDAGCSKCGLCLSCIAMQETEHSDPKQLIIEEDYFASKG